jgi:flagellar protein FlgJ
MSLDRVASNTKLPREERLAAAGRAFEAVFIRQILDAAQKTVIPSGLTQESSSSAVYRDLVSETLADRIARSGQFGLASTLLADWGKSRPVSETAEGKPAVPVPGFAATPEAALATAAARPQLKPFRHGSSLNAESSRSQLKPFRP